MKKIYRFFKSKQLAFFSSAIILTAQVRAQVSAYTFTQTTGTYVPVTGPDLFSNFWDDNATSPVSIGFNFTFNGVVYTDIAVASNGFITFGTNTPNTNEYSPLSSAFAYDGAIAAFGRDMVSDFVLSAVSYTTTGTLPNRKCIVQWNNAMRYSGGSVSGDDMSFQIILNETTNKIDIVYGNCTATSTLDGITGQIGLRGASNSDFNNRSGGSNTAWAVLTAGTANNDNVNFKSTIGPVSGLTFSWLPPSCFSPTGIAAFGNLSTATSFSWTSTATAFDLYYGPSPLVAPTATTVPTATTALTSYTAAGLTAATAYALYVRSNCGSGNISNWSPVKPFMTACAPPAITATSPGTRCGIGTVTLGATSAGTLNWFTAATGGTSIATGSVFTTPTISSTTNYYVSSTSTPNTSAGGLLVPIPTSSVSVVPSGEGIVFDANQTFTLNSVDVYPDGPSDDIYIDLYDVNYNFLGTYTATMPAGNGTTPFTIPINTVIQPGSGYFFRVYTDVGTPLVSNTGVTFPYAISSLGSVTSGYYFGPVFSDYSYLYNLQVTSVCEGPRTVVTASVTPTPALTVALPPKS